MGRHLLYTLHVGNIQVACAGYIRREKKTHEMGVGLYSETARCGEGKENWSGNTVVA